VVAESDEGNNQSWRDVYVGFAGPILLDSGGAGDSAYSEAAGYGYLNGTASTFCGADPDHSQRSDFSGEVGYRFDQLLPGHFYHLDLVLYECDGLGRVESIEVDGNVLTDTINLSDGNVHRISIRLDPALYADHSIVVGVKEQIGYDAVVSAINLHDIDYRYADSGGTNDLAYPGDTSPRYGWLDGVVNSPWGTLPYQTRRIDLGDADPSDDPDDELRYRFDSLKLAKSYQLNFTVYQGAGSLASQTIYVDVFDTGETTQLSSVALSDEARVDLTERLPAADGSIVVRIVRTNASAGAYVNEIALEERTIPWEGDADWQGPTITNVSYSLNATSDQTVTVTAEISDANTGNSGVDSARLAYGYTAPYDSHTVAGSGAGDGAWTFVIPAQGPSNEGKSLRFAVLATDGDDTPETTRNSNGGAYFSVAIEDGDPVGPNIATPDYPGAVAGDESFDVAVNISDSATGGHGVSVATLYYGYSEPYNQNAVGGTSPGGNGDGSWTFPIPAQGSGREGQTLTLWLQASDGDNSPATTTDDGPYQVNVVAEDNTAPLSGAVSPQYANATFDVDWTASDAESGVDQVQLWAKVGAGAWTATGIVQAGTSGTFSYSPAAGQGTYCFATVATDNYGNQETLPTGVGDTCTILDTMPPASTASAPELTELEQVQVTWSASDNLAGVASVNLWVRFDDGSWEDTGLAAQTGISGAFEYSFAYGLGTYEFAARAIDNAGNDEGVPTVADSTTMYRVANRLYVPIIIKQ
jgi:hypothetical protein